MWWITPICACRMAHINICTDYGSSNISINAIMAENLRHWLGVQAAGVSMSDALLDHILQSSTLNLELYAMVILRVWKQSLGGWAIHL